MFTIDVKLSGEDGWVCIASFDAAHYRAALIDAPYLVDSWLADNPDFITKLIDWRLSTETSQRRNVICI